MYRVNVIFDDGLEIVQELRTEAMALEYQSWQNDNPKVVETKLLRPAKDVV